MDEDDYKIEIKIQRLVPNAKLPVYLHDGDAGLDLFALEYATIQPGHRQKIRTGIAIELPEGYAGLIVPRSGLTVKHGITVLNTPGLVDYNYRGELMVVLHNADPSQVFRVNVEARIAQLLIVEVPQVTWVEGDNLSESVRGNAGFGSTGM